MAYTNDSIWKTVDWWTILLYLILITCGWFSVCGAAMIMVNPNFLDFTTRAGKQLMWIGCSLGLGFVLLMLEHRLYDTYAYLIYGILLLLLFGTIFNPHEIKGSRSWIGFRAGKPAASRILRSLLRRWHWQNLWENTLFPFTRCVTH